MWSAWLATVPPSLIHEDPRLLFRFLELSSTSDGIFQQELKRGLGVNQPRLSKLTRKLVEVGWLTVSTPKDDRRKRLAITTVAGKKGLAVLRSKLGALVSRPSASPRPKISRKEPRVGLVQTTFDLPDPE